MSGFWGINNKLSIKGINFMLIVKLMFGGYKENKVLCTHLMLVSKEGQMFGMPLSRSVFA